jgi:hypothetical protein
VWDNEAADIAQLWADQCQSGHDVRRDTGSTHKYHSTVNTMIDYLNITRIFSVFTGGNQKNGQNIMWAGSSTVGGTRAVDAWYNEVLKFNATAQLNPFAYVFHFAQRYIWFWIRLLSLVKCYIIKT